MAKARRTRKDSDAGVRRCMQLMADGLWVTGRSHETVAAEYGVSPATAKDWATSASRVLRLSIEGDKEDIRARLLATLDTCVSRAMQTKKPVYRREGAGRDTLTITEVWDAPEVGAAVAAIAEQGKLLGLHTENLSLSGAVTEEQLVAFRAAVVALLCEGCRTKVLEHVRRTKETKTP